MFKVGLYGYSVYNRCINILRVKSMRYQCLILDHDDTAVDSTGYIHYPSFVQALKELRPNEPVLTLEQFVDYCFNPGFTALCQDIEQFSQSEMQRQQTIWRQYNQALTAQFFSGFPQLVRAFKQRGGKVTVISQSDASKIESDYLTTCHFKPDIVYGWDAGPGKRKPATYPVKQILQRLQLAPEAALVVDDLRPGLEMAAKCGVPFAAAGWAPKTPRIKAWMQSHADMYFSQVDQLAAFLLA